MFHLNYKFNPVVRLLDYKKPYKLHRKGRICFRYITLCFLLHFLPFLIQICYVKINHASSILQKTMNNCHYWGHRSYWNHRRSIIIHIKRFGDINKNDSILTWFTFLCVSYDLDFVVCTSTDTHDSLISNIFIINV